MTLQNTATTQSESTQTDSQGHFTFTGVAAGKYLVTAHREGFDDAQRSVEIGEAPVTMSMALKIATQETVVEVGGKRSATANSDPNLSGAARGCARRGDASD